LTYAGKSRSEILAELATRSEDEEGAGTWMGAEGVIVVSNVGSRRLYELGRGSTFTLEVRE
jgi:hypothetical protein